MLCSLLFESLTFITVSVLSTKDGNNVLRDFVDAVSSPNLFAIAKETGVAGFHSMGLIGDCDGKSNCIDVLGVVNWSCAFRFEIVSRTVSSHWTEDDLVK